MEKSETIKKQNYKLDVLKFIYCIAIMLVHSNQLQSANSTSILFCGGWLAVDFFFIVSGCLMAETALEKWNCNSEYSTIKYIIQNIKSLFPYVFLSFVFCLIIRYGSSVKDIIKGLGGSIFELSYLRMSGIQSWYSNDLTWYISAMMIAKLVLFPLLLKYKHKFTTVFCSFGSIIILGYLSYTYGRMGITYTWTGIAYVGLVRAFLGLMSGCVCYELAKYLRTFQFRKFGKVLIRLVEYFLVAITLFIMHFRDSFSKSGYLDFFCFIFLFILVTIVFSDQTIIKSIGTNQTVLKLCLFLRKYSLSIYLNQYVFLLIAKKGVCFANSFWMELLIYVCCTFVIALIALPFIKVEKKLFYWMRKLIIQ